MKFYCTRLLLLVAMILATSVSMAGTLHGRVVRVIDGDTVTVLDAEKKQWKVRLMSIDAPEMKQAYGKASKKSLSDLLFNKLVDVVYNKKDNYGRTVGKIIVNGYDTNLEQVKKGMAWHYKEYQNEQTVEDRFIYSDAENLARSKKRGLWSDANPIPPWEWRKLQKKKRIK